MTNHSGNWEGINPSKKSGMLKRYGLGPAMPHDQHAQDRNFYLTFGVSVDHVSRVGRNTLTLKDEAA